MKVSSLSIFFAAAIASVPAVAYPSLYSTNNQRQRVTIRASQNDTDDVSAEFLNGIKVANNGGTLVLKQNDTYIIGKKLELSGLNDIEVNLEGEIKFTDDIDYWQSNNFAYSFQNSITFWVWSGDNIKIYGEGTLNGNGQEWYNGFAGNEILDSDNTYLRPILFTVANSTNVTVEGIHFLNSPVWNTFLYQVNNIAFDNVHVLAYSTNASADPKNTDGFDSLRVDGLSITNSDINIGDDCISPKPNTTNIFIQNVWCNGTHGVSMGSIGQYSGQYDIIENAYIQNVTLLNGQNGARLKSWAGADVGYGIINNITYKDIYVSNTDNPILIDSCYFDINATECAAYPSQVNVTNILFQNITGTSSGKNGDIVAYINCSPSGLCANISFVDVDLTAPGYNDTEVICNGVTGDIGVACIESNVTVEAKRMKW
ncbi:MAG: hypothetical protein M1834_007202 [Cirrosporium novae-zelandiae]|nr:MAG: hypothetical protein M1834_007202 [Cirrosporium novae-zelandiae]